LGLNLGHLARLLPVAQKLKADGHVVLAAVRDIQAAAMVFGPAGIPFIQAPHLPKGIPLSHRATGYADILLSQGWSDESALWGLTQGWLNIFQLFRPDKLILDYSPTVSLAARIAKIPSILVGNGFELPPLTDPLLPFPGFSWATSEKAAQAEGLAVDNANEAIGAFKGQPISALRDLTMDQTCLFATFPELDHYGERRDAEYVGPLLGKLTAPRVEWPEGDGPKIFACLRPDTSHVKVILTALTTMTARVVCVASGFTMPQLEIYRNKHIRYSLGPMDLQPLLDADLCITYGAEGTMMWFLMAGVPQLILPWHVETYMAARRVEAAGLGSTLERSLDAWSVQDLIERLTGDTPVRNSAKAFAVRHTTTTHDSSADLIVRIVTRGVRTAWRTQAPVPHESVSCVAGAA